MRCGCPQCGTYMIQSDGITMGCICPDPDCGYRCTDCLGTKTLISRETLAQMKQDPIFEMQFLSKRTDDEEE